MLSLVILTQLICLLSWNDESLGRERKKGNWEILGMSAQNPDF